MASCPYCLRTRLPASPAAARMSTSTSTAVKNATAVGGRVRMGKAPVPAGRPGRRSHSGDIIGVTSRGRRGGGGVVRAATVVPGDASVTIGEVPLKGSLPPGCHLVSSCLNRVLKPMLSGVTAGMVNIFLQHEGGASLCLNEKCDPAVQTDLFAAMDRIFPTSAEDDHIGSLTAATTTTAWAAKAMAMGQSLDLPVLNGQLGLGSYQGIYLCDWGMAAAQQQVPPTDDSPKRRLLVTIQRLRISEDVALRSHQVDARGSAGGVLEAAAAALPHLRRCSAGLAHLMVRHTSASMVLHSPLDQCHSLEAWASKVVPDQWSEEMFVHTYEGPDDMPAHVKQALVGAGVALPVRQGKLRPCAGDARAPHLWEHRNVRPGAQRQTAYVLVQPHGVHIANVSVPLAKLGSTPVVHSDGTLAATETAGGEGWQAEDVTERVQETLTDHLTGPSRGDGAAGNGMCVVCVGFPGGSVCLGPRSRAAAEAAVGYLVARLLLHSPMDGGHHHPATAATAAGWEGVASVLGSSVSIPIRDGRLSVGDGCRVWAVGSPGVGKIDLTAVVMQ